uniref:Exportin-T n=1 Tax=Rhipicephalus zambeziensis TaxID=60191 RepID=A0A224YMP4_9ACAR
MDVQVIQGFLANGDQAAHARALQYFEQLKSAPNGWQLSMQMLLQPSVQDDSVKFFCLSVLEHYIKTGYEAAKEGDQQAMRTFISQWIQMQVYAPIPEKVFIRNKVAQLVCWVFLWDYPARWPSFFADILQTLSLGPPAVDAFLRVLLAINSEIADCEIPRTAKEQDRNRLLKDNIRETHIVDLVNSWYTILTTQCQSPAGVELCRLCLEVVGAYVAWIDIGLVANDRFVDALVHFLSLPALRESACDCVCEILAKGMDPADKARLVESLSVVLQRAGVLTVAEGEDVDFLIKLAKLVNAMGIQLFDSYSKLHKKGDGANRQLVQSEVASKVPLMLQFLGHEDDDVSQGVAEFAREYIQYLKHEPGNYKQPDKANMEAVLYIVINKYKYDSSYLFERQGEDEALFLEYRKTLKVLFDNVAQLDKDMTLSLTQSMISSTLQNWRSLPFQDVEVAISFLYLLGEAIPGFHNAQMAGAPDGVPPVVAIMRQLISSGVSTCGHPAVTLQFFETIVRYEKFFSQEPESIPDVLVAFMDERGLRHPSPSVRSRVSYLFSKFIKSHKAHMLNFTEDILKQVQELLVLCPTENGVTMSSLLSPDDQLYLFEATAMLIVSGQFNAEKKQLLLKNQLTPVMRKFEALAQRLPLEPSEEKRRDIAECMNHAIAVTSRTSKAFSNQQTMKACSCVSIYLEALQVFLQALDLPYEQPLLQAGVRQFLHRMVVCLEEEVLPLVPRACEQLLRNPDVRSVQELIPLINQIVCKFKKEVVPFLQRMFMPLVGVIFGALAAPVEPGDEQALRDRQLLQRAYFLFVAAIITNNVVEVVASQDAQSLEQVFTTIIQGAVEFPDPVAQKTCFTILRKMVELWGGPDAEPHFVDFVYKSVVPACFHAPLKDTFDLTDAQTILALSESALCMKMILAKRGEEFMEYLRNQYLPTLLRLSPQQIQDYCMHLQGDPKVFKNYVKAFFQRLRTS